MYWIFCTLLLVSLSTAAPQRDDSSAMLQSGVKTLMGYRDLPLGEKGLVRDAYDGRVVPRYMLDLYSRYRDKDIASGGGFANTARSISAEIGMVNGDSMFIFNLTAVDSSETILSSDVHIYRKKRRSDSALTVTLYELAPYYITELSQSRLHPGKSGWQVFSVTDAVKSCLATRRPSPHILALGFSRPKNDGALKRLQLKAFIHHISRPFLVVHSNSNANITEDHIHARLTATNTKNTYVNPENGKTQKFRKNPPKSDKEKVKSYTKVTVKQETTETTKPTLNKKPASGYKQEVLRRKLALQKKQNEARIKRSILTNEIPEDPSVPLIPQQKSRGKQASPPSRQKTFSMADFDFQDQQMKHSQYSSENARRKRRRKHKSKTAGSKKSKSQSSGKKGELPSPEEWGLEYTEEKQRSGDRGKFCNKKKLVLHFTDIGWSNWIIAPKALESNYCSGSCPYPQSQHMPGLSNHATLQSLVHAVAITPEVPAPCCVAAVTTSRSLLYFDQYGNVVLKNYPNMEVKSCECR